MDSLLIGTPSSLLTYTIFHLRNFTLRLRSNSGEILSNSLFFTVFWEHYLLRIRYVKMKNRQNYQNVETLLNNCINVTVAFSFSIRSNKIR